MDRETKIRSIQRGLASLEIEIRNRETDADIEHLYELESAVQVLKLYLQALKSQSVVAVRPEIIDSFSMDLKLRLTCLLDNVCSQ